MLFLALTDERGNLVWISAARPGRSSEVTTARHNKISARLRPASGRSRTSSAVSAWTTPPDDPAIVTGRKATRGHPLTQPQKESNKLNPNQASARPNSRASRGPRIVDKRGPGRRPFRTRPSAR
ncbi:hypothetical protein [Streptomyces sp. NPDC002922]|uniref:hypothetical protein n=1 Tax=Streptomyces sp. NPDC002922 TaxID=3154439 RepID=UPI0033BD2994